MNVFLPADILIPDVESMEKWSVIACDQFSSQPEYWKDVKETVGDAPVELPHVLLLCDDRSDGLMKWLSGKMEEMRQIYNFNLMKEGGHISGWLVSGKLAKDFEKQISGAVWLNADGRKKVLSKWQEKKRTDLMHPYLKQKIPFGLLPYVQSNLLAKYIRGDIESYPPYLQK